MLNHRAVGYCPHYVMLLVSATAGVVGMTQEHLGIAVALEVPFFIVVTKVCCSSFTVGTGRYLGTYRTYTNTYLGTVGYSLIAGNLSNKKVNNSNYLYK